jgi:hypothetical protein
MALAMKNRVDAARRGGTVVTPTLRASHVDPQIKHTTINPMEMADRPGEELITKFSEACD